jgi:hypothetical protein
VSSDWVGVSKMIYHGFKLMIKMMWLSEGKKGSIQRDQIERIFAYWEIFLATFKKL